MPRFNPLDTFGGDILKSGGEEGDDRSPVRLALNSTNASSRAFSSASRSPCACFSPLLAVVCRERAVLVERAVSLDVLGPLSATPRASARSRGIHRDVGGGGLIQRDDVGGLLLEPLAVDRAEGGTVPNGCSEDLRGRGEELLARGVRGVIGTTCDRMFVGSRQLGPCKIVRAATSQPSRRLCCEVGPHSRELLMAVSATT